MRILVTDGMDKTAMAQLREMGHEVVEQFYEPDQLGAALKDFDAVVVRSKTKVRANHIDEAKTGKLKLIIRGGVGVDNIDVKYAESCGITVKNTPRASSQSVAELAMGHMFSCARYLSIAGHTMREDKWEKKAYGKGIELQGKTLGIVGFGRIGQHLGVMAKAIGMKVVAFDIFHIPCIEEQLGIPYVGHAQKPRTTGFHRAMEQAGATAAETAMIGDKLLTDMLGANLAGVLALMVEPAGGPKGAWNRVLHALQAPFKAVCRRRHT